MKYLCSTVLVVFVAINCGSEDAPPLFVSHRDDDGGSRSTRVVSRDSSTALDSSKTLDSSRPRDVGSNQDSSSDEDAETDASVDPDSGEVALDGPQVEIVEPLAAANPVDNDILVEAPVTVQCRVTKSEDEDAAAVDPTSVKIALLIDDSVIEEKQGVSKGNYEFEATFTSSELQGGLIAFRCSAKDTATPSRSSSDEIETYYDSGPDIEIIDPEAETSVSLNEQVRVEFRVAPLKLDTSDSESEIDEVNLKVAGVDIDLEEVESEDGLYRAFIDFNDAVLFPNTPTGSTSIVISATNQRTPEAAKRIVTYNIVVDAEGPDITIESPEDLDIVGGDVVLEFVIEDGFSEVDNDSLVVEINDTPFAYDPEGQWSINDNTYTYRFDTRNFPSSTVQITINIDVDDMVGNAAPGASMVLYLDNQPPIVDLDPPMVREIKEQSTNWYCSFAFDPVGYKAVNNYETTQRMVLFRSVVWDMTNSAPGQTIWYYSTVDPETVYLYIQDDVDTPLLIDTDGDDICDELDREGLTDQDMDALTPAGSPFYGGVSAPDYAIDSVLEPALSGCSYQDSTTIPKDLCTNEASEMKRVIAHSISGAKEPAIYALQVVPNGPACTGDSWEVGAFIEPGPFCAAVRAEDYEGNIGVSAPLVLCYDDSDTPEDECDGFDENTEITCTDGCSPAPGFESLEPLILYPR